MALILYLIPANKAEYPFFFLFVIVLAVLKYYQVKVSTLEVLNLTQSLTLPNP